MVSLNVIPAPAAFGSWTPSLAVNWASASETNPIDNIGARKEDVGEICELRPPSGWRAGGGHRR